MKTRKFLSLVLALVLATTMFAGCGGQTTKPEEPEDIASTDIPKVKYGFITWGTTDELGRISAEYVRTFVEDIVGGEVIINTDGTAPEIIVQSVENLIAAGCNCISLIYADESCLPKIAEMCESAGVYWGIQWRRIKDESIRALLFDGDLKYFIGNTGEDEENGTYQLGAALGKAGVKECALITRPLGQVVHQRRDEGYLKAFEEYGITKVAEIREQQKADTIAQTTENFILNYPNLDAIALTAGSNGVLEGCINTLDKLGKRGEVLTVCVDFIDSAVMADYLADGTLVAMCGGHYCDPYFTAVMLCNAVQGNRLSETPVDNAFPYIVLTTEQESYNYSAYVENDKEKNFIYTADEMAQMLVSNNPNFTQAELTKLVESYSIKDVMDRHGFTDVAVPAA